MTTSWYSPGRRDEPPQLGVLPAHRRHGVPPLHEPVQLAVEGGLDRLHVGQELAHDEPVLRLALDQELGRDALVDHPGQPGQLLDMRDEPIVVLVGGLGEGIHGRDGTPVRAPPARRPQSRANRTPKRSRSTRPPAVPAIATRATGSDAAGVARRWHQANPVLADPDLALAGDGPRSRRNRDAEDRRVGGRRRRRVGHDELDPDEAGGAAEGVDERGAGTSGVLIPLGPGQLVLDEERGLSPAEPAAERRTATPRTRRRGAPASRRSHPRSGSPPRGAPSPRAGHRRSPGRT